MSDRKGRAVGSVILALVLGSVIWVGAGSLTPPAGPVSPTMKTLTEVEPRIEVSATTTPGDANNLFIISSPGSYYLADDIAGVGGKNGIKITAAGVSLDLRGFSIEGPSSTDTGIDLTTANTDGVSIANGIIRGWDIGIDGFFGGAGGTFSNLRVIDNDTGMQVIRAIVTNCVAEYNTGWGILNDEGRTSNCLANSNGTGFGTFFGGTIEGCSGKFNSYGIDLGGGSLAIHNAMSLSFVTGVFLRDYSRVIGNVFDEGMDGIYLDNAFGAGVGNVIEDNVITRMTGIGINLSLAGVSDNFVARNRCHGNGTNYDMGTGNSYGPIVNVAGVGDVSGTANADHPLANYSY